MTWYPATAANADSGDAVIKETQYENNAPVIPYKTRTSHYVSKESTLERRIYVHILTHEKSETKEPTSSYSCENNDYNS